VSKVFWQAKIWGLLHDPVFKAFHDNSGRGQSGLWQEFAVMKDWVERDLDPAKWNSDKAITHLKKADQITAASDRGAIGSLSISVNYAGKDNPEGLYISHLLSGAKTSIKLNQLKHNQIAGSSRKQFLNEQEAALFNFQINQKIDNVDVEKFIKEITDPQMLFWWLWRCLPTAACKRMGNDTSVLLMPAETRIPDASIWSHTSLTSAMAGAMTGFDITIEDFEQKWSRNQRESRPYLATFSFSPVQELIKASRKMRDFWAGSWLLHYLSAKVSWRLAIKYGPDCLVYPSLFHQPLIDAWLLKKWPDFKQWIKTPTERQILTAGFPNVIVILLPEGKIDAAMQLAKQALEEEWLHVGNLVFDKLQKDRCWMPELTKNHVTWNGWLETQWQTYWSAMPVGDRNLSLTSNEIHQSDQKTEWRGQQNDTFQVTVKNKPFSGAELDFISKAAEIREKKYDRKSANANVGSWWPYVFDLTRKNVSSVKNARNWQLPTAFDSRSTISGLGSIVHHYDIKHKVTVSEAQALWTKQVGLFNGSEQLNASEVVKRGLHLIIHELVPGLNPNDDKVSILYPDLTAGVVGYLKTRKDDSEGSQHLQNFQEACEKVEKRLSEIFKSEQFPCDTGIPWVKTQPETRAKSLLTQYHSRYLSPGWLIEEVDGSDDELQKLKADLDQVVNKHYPGNNPCDWYVLAAGDGDGMSLWLKGSKLEKYEDYVPEGLTARASEDPELDSTFLEFLKVKKRMGPSTHGALSRALLDFSNQLVPYLTEQRHAGRLIYSGGDDVLAYTNLWEWDEWLWSVRQCFRGAEDPGKEFNQNGDYWQWKPDNPHTPESLTPRPLFTMGRAATISFGIVIASQNVPMAIALENMWEAEEGAKNHFCSTLPSENSKERKKNAVQVRVLYANGNILTATSKFETFDKWRCLLKLGQEAALFEQAAQVWSQHPAPLKEAIDPWIKAFSERRDALAPRDDLKMPEQSQADLPTVESVLQSKDLNPKEKFITTISNWIHSMWETNDNDDIRDQEIGYWLKLAAFVIRKRDIAINLGGDS
jgi:CRISPR-associated protein Cmr2